MHRRVLSVAVLVGCLALPAWGAPASLHRLGVPFFLAVVLSGCFAGGQPSPASKVEEELKSARALRISYVVGMERKQFTVSDARELQAILRTLRVTGVDQSLQSGILAIVQVVFILPNGQMIETQFINPRELDRSYSGIIDVTEDFYASVREAISKREGTPTDPLKQHNMLD